MPKFRSIKPPKRSVTQKRRSSLTRSATKRQATRKRPRGR